MNLDTTQALVGLCLSVIALTSAALVIIRKARPLIARATEVWGALMELLFGKAAEPQNPITGAAATQPVAGLGMRVANIEQRSTHQGAQLEILTEAVAKLVDAHERLDNHERRIKGLEDAAIERVFTKVESTAAWDAVAAVAGQHDPVTASIEEKS